MVQAWFGTMGLVAITWADVCFNFGQQLIGLMCSGYASDLFLCYSNGMGMENVCYDAGCLLTCRCWNFGCRVLRNDYKDFTTPDFSPEQGQYLHDLPKGHLFKVNFKWTIIC